jgi:hypothetical protein
VKNLSLGMIVSKTNSIIGKKNCILCCTDFDFVAIISGDSNLEDIKGLHEGKEVTDHVVVLKKNIGNNNKLHIIDVEITVKCPHCHSNNRFNEFITIVNIENE